MEAEILIPDIRSYGTSAIDHKPKASTKIYRSKRRRLLKKFKARMAVEVIRDNGAEKKRRKASPDSLTDRNLCAPQHDDDDTEKTMELPDSSYYENLDVGKNGRMVPPDSMSDRKPDVRGVCAAKDFERDCQYNLRPKPHRRT